MANKTIIKAHTDKAGTAIGVDDLTTGSLVVEGDLTVDTDTLYVDSVNNHIGMGTTTPTTFGGFTTVHHKNSSGDAINLVESDGGAIHQIITSDTYDGGSPAILVGARSNHPLVIQANDSEKMRIDTNGNVGIGTGNPETNFHIYAGDASQTVNSALTQFAIENSGHAGLQILSGASSYGIIYFGDSGSVSNGEISYLHGATPQMEFWVDATQTMVLESGKVGIGTDAPATKLHVNLANSASPGDSNGLRMGTFQWRVQDTGGFNRLILDRNFGGWQSDAIHIRADGNVGIGATNPGSKLEVNQTTAATCAKFINNTVSAFVVQVEAASDNSNTSYPMMAFIDGNNDTCGSIRTNNSANTTAYNTSSDGRLKTKHAKFNGLNIVHQMKPLEYERTTTPGTKEYGFIAQELFDVLPQAVHVGGEDPSENPWQIDYSKVTSVLCKAIQELSQSLDEAKAEIELLKNN